MNATLEKCVRVQACACVRVRVYARKCVSVHACECVSVRERSYGPDAEVVVSACMSASV